MDQKYFLLCKPGEDCTLSQGDVVTVVGANPVTCENNSSGTFIAQPHLGLKIGAWSGKSMGWVRQHLGGSLDVGSPIYGKLIAWRPWKLAMDPPPGFIMFDPDNPQALHISMRLPGNKHYSKSLPLP